MVAIHGYFHTNVSSASVRLFRSELLAFDLVNRMSVYVRLDELDIRYI